MKRNSELFAKLGYCLLALALGIGALFAAAPTVIQPTDLISTSRATLNSNFLNLYNGSSGLIDCSGTTGAFVVTLNGGGTIPACRTLTWSIISSLAGFPSGFVNSFNSRTGTVTLQSSDVATVEQDLRNTASPNFASLGLGANLGVTGNATIGGTLGVTGNTTLSGTLNSGAATLLSSSVTGNELVGGTFGVTGNTTLSGTLAAGATTITGAASVSGILSSNGGFATTAVPATFGVPVTGPTGIIVEAGTYAQATSAITCGSTTFGAIATITDSNTNTWGATIAGSGSNKVLGFCNGTLWTVAAK